MNNQNQHRLAAKPILIFPGGMPRSLEFLKACLRDGQPVLGASSLDHDVSRENYPVWAYLPYITQSEFDESLKLLVSKFSIGGIYSPNPVVWGYLSNKLKYIAPDVELVNESPVNTELSSYRAARSWAYSQLSCPLPIASELMPKAHLTEIRLASYFRHAEQIPGMCDHEKFFALYEVMRRCTDGDVVEIGSWWGKSAFILAMLARSYGIGNLLCVDPWSNEHLVQNDEGGLVDAESARMDANEALAVFEMNLLPYSSTGQVNYLRMPSTEGAIRYGSYKNAITETFGSTDYCGCIAILHIDGNHQYEAVKADIAVWTGFVVSGGWIVIDDYIWPYGDGPKRAGDEYLAINIGKISTAFVMGTALFMQLSD